MDEPMGAIIIKTATISIVRFLQWALKQGHSRTFIKKKSDLFWEMAKFSFLNLLDNLGSI